MRWPSRTGLTTAEVSGLLYQDGVAISRDRLYRVADRLFPAEDLRPKALANRRFTTEQVAVLRPAFVMLDLLGMPIDEILALIPTPDRLELAMRHQLAQRSAAVESSLSGFAEALSHVKLRQELAADQREVA